MVKRMTDPRAGEPSAAPADYRDDKSIEFLPRKPWRKKGPPRFAVAPLHRQTVEVLGQTVLLYKRRTPDSTLQGVRKIAIEPWTRGRWLVELKRRGEPSTNVIAMEVRGEIMCDFRDDEEPGVAGVYTWTNGRWVGEAEIGESVARAKAQEAADLYAREELEADEQQA